MGRILHLTHKQYEVLYDVIADTVQFLEEDLITYTDDKGNEVEEKIEEYEVFKIYQKLQSMRKSS
tara:strand:- start:189 stop:383 length:195 start_codon:yes stop_codon:yes gene_type:complete